LGFDGVNDYVDVGARQFTTTLPFNGRIDEAPLQPGPQPGGSAGNRAIDLEGVLRI
jgi:hypothetical protein